MPKILLLLVFLLSNLILNAQSLEVDLFQKAMNSQPSAKIVDIRSHSIFMKGHIKNAINLDFDLDDFESLIGRYFKKEQSLLLYGGSDYMTNNAVMFLKELGFDKVKSLKGGFAEWISASKPYKTDQYSGPLASFTPKNFEAMKQRYNKLLVFLETPSCSYCLKMKPYLAKTAAANGTKLLKIDIAQNENMSYYFEATGTPTMLIFDRKKQVWKGNGFMSPEALDEMLKRYF